MLQNIKRVCQLLVFVTEPCVQRLDIEGGKKNRWGEGEAGQEKKHIPARSPNRFSGFAGIFRVFGRCSVSGRVWAYLGPICPTQESIFHAQELIFHAQDSIFMLGDAWGTPGGRLGVLSCLNLT